MANWFTISTNTDVDVYINDIINNLDKFSQSELTILYSELSKILLNKNHLSADNNKIFEILSLNDEYKLKILKEIFNNYTLEDIDNILIMLKNKK
jgi:predicted metallopeptidase